MTIHPQLTACLQQVLRRARAELTALPDLDEFDEFRDVKICHGVGAAG